MRDQLQEIGRDVARDLSQAYSRPIYNSQSEILQRRSGEFSLGIYAHRAHDIQRPDLPS